MERPVIGKTNIKRVYDSLIPFGNVQRPVTDDPVQALIRHREGLKDQLPSRLEEQLVLRFEPVKEIADVWVIERADKPSEN